VGKSKQTPCRKYHLPKNIMAWSLGKKYCVLTIWVFWSIRTICGARRTAPGVNYFYGSLQNIMGKADPVPGSSGPPQT
jgi:hypothetical protein